MWFAVPPAVLAVGLLAVGISETTPTASGERRTVPISRAELGRLDARYWWVVAAGSLFTLARFSDAFLLLRARETGLPLAWTPLVMLALTAAYSAAAYPAGLLADRIDRRHILALGAVFLIVADLVLASPTGTWGVMIGAAIWGLHMGFTQGLLAALVSDTAPETLRGTAFGVFNLITGVVLLLSSALAGYLWSEFGSAATFLAGGAFTGVALLVFAVRPTDAPDS
jgi:MFS family permease